MDDINKTARQFYKAVEGVTKNERKGGYDTQATVRRIEDGVAWVHIPGGVDETPAKLTINASEGDVVQVRIANGRAFLVGNASAPPTDNAEAIKALSHADIATEAATIARLRADEATADAARAHEAADAAQESADDAAQAASDAMTAAGNAQTSATTANTAANNALQGLSTVESVVDVVNWFNEHKTASADTTVDPSKTYYSYDAQTGALTKLDPDGTEDPSALGWYEMSDAVADYVATHVATTADGLSVLSAANGWRVLISSGGGSKPAGIFLIDPNGNIAQQTTINGVEFNTGRPVKIGDQTAYINFDGNGHITVIGADLTVGGANNVSGVLTVKDATGATIGTWDKDGINTNAGLIGGWTLNPTKLSSTGIDLYSIYSGEGNLQVARNRVLFSNNNGDNLALLRPMIGTGYSYGLLGLSGTTEGSNAYGSNNPKIVFGNAAETQRVVLIFTDYDSVQTPASLTLTGNQGGEYFIAPNIKVTSGLEVGAAKFYTPSETTATKSGSYITSGTITVHRRGNVGHIYGNITIGSDVASQTTIATIPDGYRPVTTDFFSATNGSFFRVNSSGTIQAQNALTAGNYYFSTTYLLA